MKRWIAPFAGLMIAGAVVVPAFAQTPNTTNPIQPDAAVRGGGRIALICSTSNIADTVAEALGMSASDLRVALVSGQSVSDLATSKNVDIQTIKDALVAERQGELDQALADGLVTQEQYDAITTALKNAPALNNDRLGIRVPAHNVVNIEATAAEALGISCADLVKEQQGGSTIAEIATDKGVEVQSVIDAITTAYKAALAKDVEEGLITQAQADGRSSNLSVRVGQWVYDAQRGGQRDGQHGFGGPMGGFGQRGGQNGPGQDGQQGNGQNGPGQRGGQGGMPNPPQSFGQQNAPNAPDQPEATVTPNT